MKTRFPADKQCYAEWINVIRIQRREPNWIPSRNCRVCSLHFQPYDIFKNYRGKQLIVRGAIPIDTVPGKTVLQKDFELNLPSHLPLEKTDEANMQKKITDAHTNQIVIDDEVESETDDAQGDVMTERGTKGTCNMTADEIQPVSANLPCNIRGDSEIENVADNVTQQTADKSLNNKQGNPTEGGSLSLDKFKRRLVRAVARKIQQKTPEKDMWRELKKEIGCHCQMLWLHMRALTLKKLKRLLPANDLLVNLKKIARFTATDWLLFDLILVHEKINVINVSESTDNAEQKEEPECLRHLFELVKTHDVESLTGDDLTEAWIRVTLQYNSSGRQCSPMLLQMRWYQMKELSRAKFYNFWCEYRGNHKMLDRAMKYRPTRLQTAIAGEYKKIVTETYPDWEKLIEQRRVILSEEFTLHRELKQKSMKSSKNTVTTTEENDVELEVIEPQVETINLEVDSDEEMDIKRENSCCTNNIGIVTKQESVAAAHDNGINSKDLTSITNIKSESDHVLDLDGLSDVETMHIPIEGQQDNIHAENLDEQYEKSSEGILNSDRNEMLPKITNIIGNIDKSQLDNRKVNTLPEAEDTTIVQCDSDDEMDEILREKADNLMLLKITQIKSEVGSNNENSTTEITAKPYEEISPKENVSTNIVMQNCSNDMSILCDSDDEIDKLLEEKANNMCIEIPKLTEKLNENVARDINISVNNVRNEEETGGNEIDEENTIDEIAYKGQTTEKEKHDDMLDEDVFDDEQIEFVDDGIEFVEETNDNKQNNTELGTEPSSNLEEETESETDDCLKMDLKLLMNPTVFTMKLEHMEVFKFIDYKYVNNKKVIECALQESKPVDEEALKAEYIDKFRAEALRGYETDGTQSDNDIVQTIIECVHERVKCTSWLLHKPKNRAYNPIQLCKNPDFNTRLKRLTSGFLSSTRNRVLLKKCKPLTIDLHKAFEKKLINGTMYLKSGDFKSAKSTTEENTNNETVSVLPSVIPGQTMIITTPVTDDTSTSSSSKSDNQENEVSTIDRSIPSERRKVINLPDIDQVRRLNQRLLTAEVTPIRIGSNVNKPTSCKEPPQVSNDAPFVQPITIASIVQVKKEKPESDADDKDVSTPTSVKVSMAHKISDQIINLSNQIYEVDNNEVLDENPLPKQTIAKKKIGRSTSNLEKYKITNIYKSTYTPMYRDKITWTPKYSKNYVEDSLLTTDTLSKILFILNGNKDELKNCFCKQKKKKRHLIAEHQPNTQTLRETGKPEAKSELSNATAPNAHKQKKIRRKGPNISEGVKKYTGVYCCWARERILGIEKNKPNTRAHGCLKFQCQCCCRQEFVTLTTLKRTEGYVPSSKRLKNKDSMIVLSDDEDIVNKVKQNRKEVVTSQMTHENISKLDIASSTSNADPINLDIATKGQDVAAEIIVPSAKSIIESTNIGNLSRVKVKPLIFNSQAISDEENKQFKNKKICVTNMRAADGRRYKKGIEYTKSIYKKDVPPMVADRTLYINSSQLLNKPSKTPIYLGKNKMLLCSFKNQVINAPVEPVLPNLPNGVNLRILPTGELSIAIENGVQLNSDQLAALPTHIYNMQQQFDMNNKLLYNNIPVHIVTPQCDDVVKTTKKSSRTEDVVETSVGGIYNTKELGNTSAENLNVCSDNGPQKLNNENEILAEKINQQDSENIRIDSEEPSGEKNTQTDEEKQKDEPQLDNQENNSIMSKQPPVNESTVKNQDDNNVCESKSSISRKTILSDLMEMSGISTEDTVVADVIDYFPTVPSLPPTVIPITDTSRTSVGTVFLPTCSSVPKDISIAGPYSNLLSFKPTTPVNNLLNYIARIRPELNAVTSFAELKYVYENDGLFHKLDIDTGSITEIKVVIKKNPSPRTSGEPKAFIDLTDDKGDSDHDISCSFQDIPQEKQTLGEVKPIKLFKSIHPSILKSGRGRSILRNKEIVYPKKRILIDKHKRKQLLKVGDKYILVDSANESETYKEPTSSSLDSSYDSSDEEPLAKKRKRNIPIENNTETTPSIFEDLPEPKTSLVATQEEPIYEPQIPDTSGDVSDPETNIMEIEGVNPELHPVAFEEGSESDEDMCILGV